MSKKPTTPSAPCSLTIYSAVAQRIRHNDGGFPHDVLLKEFGESAAHAVYGLYITDRIGITNDGYCYWK